MHFWNVFLFLRATKEEDVDGQFQNIAYLVSLYAQEGKKMARMNRERRGHRLVLFVKTHRWMSTCKWQNDSFRSLMLTRPIYTCPFIIPISFCQESYTRQNNIHYNQRIFIDLKPNAHDFNLYEFSIYMNDNNIMFYSILIK